MNRLADSQVQGAAWNKPPPPREHWKGNVKTFANLKTKLEQEAVDSVQGGFTKAVRGNDWSVVFESKTAETLPPPEVHQLPMLLSQHLLHLASR
mmetsp:Transcript_27146/g.89025  ORF Transcript_27146/g.89025 Transcript_27146/m.89025 type:complete len:94 (-) Transcript_27146:292-573(-)|eukprot:CAMPEP_0170159208 /NCGR_PEP_ID=MMETSP0033_2-20121228/70190_1 /TAXON_ID=195969 /ORGANISM="Dolichomastix tenuilepis, Strain CCMP3274" /LENGTH=93 /DNA_ID=CAMNT_0010396679 /DNA_START=198 /DNA_END=479 /DNA_ORIENTATION=+